MKFGSFAIALGALALGLATWTTPAQAQGPMYDRVNVDLPYTVTIGDKTLQPGDYVIQQLRSPGGASRVLLIYSDRGMRFETSALTIPTLDMNTPEDTKVVLHHYGPDYYFDKIWIQGKNYGYEFPLPNSVKAREKERTEPVSVAATYQATPAPETTAQNTPPPPVATPPANPAPETTTAPAAPAPETTNAPTTTAPTTTAQNTMPPENNANREMPATSAGWLMMLLGGGALSGVGMKLRSYRR